MDKSNIKSLILEAGIKHLLLSSEGWLVGNSINCLENKEDIKDFDIIVPSRELFQNTLSLIDDRYEISFTSYGEKGNGLDNVDTQKLNLITEKFINSTWKGRDEIFAVIEKLC